MQDHFAKYEVWLTRDEIKQVQKKLKNHKFGNEKYPFNDFIGEIRLRFTRNFADEEIKIEEDETVPDFDQSLVKEYFEQVINIGLPQYLFDTFQNEYILDDTLAKQIFVEYAKFLVMLKLDCSDISPGFWIDMLWHTHMQHTKLYRDFCHSFFGKVIGHHPNNDSRYEQEEYDESHQNALKVYAKMFGPTINYQIWCDFTHKNAKNCLVNVNLLDMVQKKFEAKKNKSGLKRLFGFLG